MNYNKEGLKYFIYLCSKNIDNKYYLILPEEIKILIWNICHIKPLIQCFICNKILLSLEIDIRENLNCENFIQNNGLVKCNDC